MATKSKIEWTDSTWNPVTGCTKVSEGCANCYAEKMAMRFTGHFNVTLHPERLDQPLHWKKPRRIFVCSMGDLFHEDVPFEFIRSVFLKMRECYQHTFLLLTKRPERVLEFDEWSEFGEGNDCLYSAWQKWIWLGVTAENQKTADERIPILFQIPAAKRFVSLEPMLGAVDLKLCPDPDDILACDRESNESYPVAAEPCSSGKHWVNFAAPNRNCLDWVIIGAESGAKRRYMDMFWAIDIVKQCKATRVPVFVKQIHLLYKKSRHKYGTILSKNMADWPEDLRIRQWPE